ncbi:hypothetical protein [Streptomyces sp. G1]|uniref:hypothetical protein n=1 Tax=Streptomyces sp. G1 TaxID=361572 RepID=UPI0027E431EB|nr:hypothetical protein [Streptomyces sp. G1]
MEAIELDAFRQRHEHDSYGCGLLLGGCGVQLTTKLYTDRVCHFAHHRALKATAAGGTVGWRVRTTCT